MFKVGDRVILVERNPNLTGISPNIGQEGTVIYVDACVPNNALHKFVVDFDESFYFESLNRSYGRNAWWCGAKHIELVDNLLPTFKISHKDLEDLL